MSSKVLGTYGNILGTELGISSCSNKTAVILTWIKTFVHRRVDGETRVGVFALRDINVGESVTYDYKYIEFGPNVKCCCGAPNCRGAIGERFNSNRVKSRCSDFCIKWGFQQKRSSLLTQSPPLFDGLRTQKKQQSAW
jgi:hypothetical protein